VIQIHWLVLYSHAARRVHMPPLVSYWYEN
jgi:hypothetical protein